MFEYICEEWAKSTYGFGKTAKDMVRGGKADGRKDSEYPKDQLEKGIKVEMEHTNDPALAKEITKDHLEEEKELRSSRNKGPLRYYDELHDMESKLKKQARAYSIVSLKDPKNQKLHRKETVRDSAIMSGIGLGGMGAYGGGSLTGGSIKRRLIGGAVGGAIGGALGAGVGAVSGRTKANKNIDRGYSIGLHSGVDSALNRVGRYGKKGIVVRKKTASAVFDGFEKQATNWKRKLLVEKMKMYGPTAGATVGMAGAMGGLAGGVIATHGLGNQKRINEQLKREGLSPSKDRKAYDKRRRELGRDSLKSRARKGVAIGAGIGAAALGIPGARSAIRDINFLRKNLRSVKQKTYKARQTYERARRESEEGYRRARARYEQSYGGYEKAKDEWRKAHYGQSGGYQGNQQQGRASGFGRGVGDISTHHKNLGTTGKEKTKAEVKSKFREQARKHHPDRGGSEEKMKEVNDSWEKIQKSDWFNKLAFVFSGFEKASAEYRKERSFPGRRPRKPPMNRPDLSNDGKNPIRRGRRWEEKSAKELTTRGRHQVKQENFVFPKERRYPIHDVVHARNALARVAQHGNPEEKDRVRNAVHNRYPSIGR